VKKRTVEGVDVFNKRVLLRADFNSPVENGKIVDDTRITATMPTIIHLLDRGAKLIICSHQGRPDGKYVEQYSLKPIAEHLRELINKPIKMAPDCVGCQVSSMVDSLMPGEALVLENLRFHKEEEECDESFSKELASLGEIYVNDAFGTCHRKHASIYGVPLILKPAVAGLLLVKELKYLGDTTENPKRPFAVVFGGAKVSDKIKVVYNLEKIADLIVIGGGMSFTFMASQGIGIGTSLVQKDMIDSCRAFLEECRKKGKKVLLPVDNVVADNYKDPTDIKISANGIPDGMEGVDIGPKTSKMFCDELTKCETVVWNGPLGVFEDERFAEGTKTVMKCVAGGVKVSVIGGGDSAAAAAKFGFTNQFTHVSTGGGASLEFLEGKELPGIKVLDDA